MPKYLLLPAFLFAVHFAMAQLNTNHIDSLQSVLKTAKEDTNKVSTLFRLVSLTYTINPAESDSYLNEAMLLSKKIKWQRGIALSYKLKGGVAYVKSDFTGSLKFSQQALQNDPGDNPLFKVGVNNNMASVYNEFQQYDKVLSIYRENLLVVQNSDNKIEEINALNGMGTTFHLLKQNDSAIHYLGKAAGIAEAINSKSQLSTILCILSAVLIKQGDYEKSKVYAEKSLQIATGEKNKYVMAPALHNLAQYYLHENNFEETAKTLNQSLAIAKEVKNPKWEYDALNMMSKMYEKQNNYKDALKMYKQFVILSDSVVGDAKRQDLIRKEAEFENEKKTAILQATHASELKRQKTVHNSLMGGAGLLLLTGGALFWSYKRRRDAEELAQTTNTQMKVLRLQMNPHFIFNSLSSISDYIRRNNMDEADEYLTSFAKVMRLTLENSEQKEVPLTDDLEALHLYMQLEAKRLNNKFTYSIDVADDVDQENTLVPPMLLQPFAENSIWHGIGKKQGNGHITITIRKQNNMLHCSVEDDGIGRSNATRSRVPGEKKSLGMRITQSRINMLNKLKNTHATVHVTDKEKGLKAEIILPLETAF